MPPSTRLLLRVTPGAKRSEVVGRYGKAWKVRVAAAPEQGRANDALLDLIAGSLALPRASVELLTGHAAQDKVVELAGIEPAEADRRLTALTERELR